MSASCFESQICLSTGIPLMREILTFNLFQGIIPFTLIIQLPSYTSILQRDSRESQLSSKYTCSYHHSLFIKGYHIRIANSNNIMKQTHNQLSFRNFLLLCFFSLPTLLLFLSPLVLGFCQTLALDVVNYYVHFLLFASKVIVVTSLRFL